MNQQSIFAADFKVDESPEDKTEIVQVLLYYEKKEAKEFKRLCKDGMIETYPKPSEQNISDFLLYLLKKHYGKIDS
jgi:hypothetical protein